MKIFLTILCLMAAFNTSSAIASENYTVKKSRYSVTQTLDRLENILKQKGITIFTRVNHTKGAERVGLKMPETQLLIFGNPKMGTPLMNEAPLMGLDLPMKALSWKDEKDQVWLAYVNPSELQRRHNIKNEMIINKMSKALNDLTNKALGY